MDVLKRLAQSGVVPVVVLEDAKDAVPTAKAMLAGGIDVMEITFRTAAAADDNPLHGAVYKSAAYHGKNQRYIEIGNFLRENRIKQTGKQAIDCHFRRHKKTQRHLRHSKQQTAKRSGNSTNGESPNGTT